MDIEILPSSEAVAMRAAQLIAQEARNAIAARGRFVFAVSGGRTPWEMLTLLSREALPWSSMHLFQVDERIAPHGDPDRNYTHIESTLLSRVALPSANVHAMSVEEANVEEGAARYASALHAIAPSGLDLVHLGLGGDGHTASLVPDDPVLEVTDRDVAITEPYQQRRRMTLTYPVLNRARRVMWVVTGAEKAPMLQRLLDADQTIPAGRVRQENAVVIADAAARG